MGEIRGHLGSGLPEDEQPIVLPERFRGEAGVAPDEDIARWLRRHYPSGVAVVTTHTDEGLFGVTVSAFSYVSLSPLLVFIALGVESQTGERIRESSVFGVSFLTNRHRFLADRFAGRAPLVDRRFSDVPFVTGTTGSPLLTEGIAWLDCRLIAETQGGDHTYYVGEAATVGHGSGEENDPLLYFDSSYRRLT